MNAHHFAIVALFVACGGGASQGPKTATKTIAAAPANPQAVSKMAQGAVAAKEPGGTPRALELLREAIRIDPALWEAHFDLGIVLANAGDLKAAEESLSEAQKLAPDQEDLATALGEVRRRRKQMARGAEGLSEFVKAHPDSVKARMLYAGLLRESGQNDKAMLEVREVLVRGSNAGALAELALCHLAKNEREPAELLAKQAVEMDPKSAAAHRALGLTLLARGDDALSFQEFQKAAAADPRDPTSRMNMGVVLLRAGAYTKAEEQFRALLSISKDDTAAQVALAAALRGEAEGKNKAKLDEAKALLEQVLAKEPKHAPALYNLGVLYADFLKRPADAKPLFEKFVAEAPDNDPSRVEAQKYLTMLSDAKAPAAAKAPTGAAP
jgi:tetratricopeptide (TPR) repeat protein